MNQRMGSDLKRLGVADLAYPKVGRKRELAVLNAVMLQLMLYFHVCVCLLLFVRYIMLFQSDSSLLTLQVS